MDPKDSWAALPKKVLQELVKLFPGLKKIFAPILRGRLWTKVGNVDMNEPMEVNTAFGLDSSFRVTGFETERFDPTRSGALELQEACTHAIFSQMGVKYIPHEFRELLKTFPNPVVAFREFLKMLGIPASKITEEDTGAYTLFEECVDTMLLLSTFKATKEERKKIYDLFSMREYATAQTIAENLMFLRSVEEEYTKMKGEVVFPAYHEVMKTFLNAGYETLTAEDIVEGKELISMFMHAHERYLSLLHMEEDIPLLAEEMQATEWGVDHFYVLEAIAGDVEDAFTRLRTEEAFDPAQLDRLEGLRGQLIALYEELQKHTGSSSGPGTSGGGKSLEEQIQEALEVLEFSKGATPTFDEVKKAYKKLAKLHHPDLNPVGEKDAATAKMVALSAAYAFLEVNYN